MSAAREVYLELLIAKASPNLNHGVGDLGAFRKLKEGIDGKEETRNRLTELTSFPLSGFGCFKPTVCTWGAQ